MALVLGLFFWTPLQSADKDSKEGIAFYSGTWENALATAKSENKLIFLDLYATWCGPCKALKARTFPDAEVGAYFNSNFISLALDAEKGMGIELARKYKLTAFPTLLFVDGAGKLVAKTIGYHTPSQLLDVAKQVKNSK